MKSLREQINSLNKKDWKKFLEIRDHVKTQNSERSCEGSYLFLENIENGEIFLIYNSYDTSVEIKSAIYPEDYEDCDDLEYTSLFFCKISIPSDLNPKDINDFLSFEILKIIKNFSENLI